MFSTRVRMILRMHPGFAPSRLHDASAFPRRVSPSIAACLGALLTGAAVLTPAVAEDTPRVTTLEIVSANTAPGDGGNGWGGHQCRIVRTRDGVFTAYTIPGKNDMSREWQLAWRQKGKWTVIAGGISGREPVNLLASPDGTLHVIGWPGGKARWWSGKPGPGRFSMPSQPVPGLSEGHWPYGSAGIDGRGRLCVLSSEGEKPGLFRWSMRDSGSESAAWISGSAALDYRHCYTYVFPDAAGGLSLVSTRDVRWESLGYKKPFGQFDYVFNAFSCWHTPDPQKEPLRKIAWAEELPTRRHPYVLCTGQCDAYLDARSRMHLVYRRSGASTGGEEEVRYGVLSPDGTPQLDVKVPWSTGMYCRVFQDDRGRYYLLGSDGVIFTGGKDAVTFQKRTKLKLGWNQVEDAGFGISVPRAGTAPSNLIDVVYPSGGGKKWIYARILLHGTE